MKETHRPNSDFTIEIAEGVYYDPQLRNVHRDGKVTPLSGIEHSLLRLLYMHEHSTIPAERLSTALHGEDNVKLNALSVFIRALRRKLGSDEHTPEIIQTNIGGYRLGDPHLTDHSPVTEIVSDTLYDAGKNVHTFLNGQVIYDSEEGIVQVDDKQNNLRAAENVIMRMMVARRPRYTDAYDFLLELEDQGYNSSVYENIPYYINVLRRKVQVPGVKENLIRSQKNVGYKIFDYTQLGGEMDFEDSDR